MGGIDREGTSSNGFAACTLERPCARSLYRLLGRACKAGEHALLFQSTRPRASICAMLDRSGIFAFSLCIYVSLALSLSLCARLPVYLSMYLSICYSIYVFINFTLSLLLLPPHPLSLFLKNKLKFRGRLCSAGGFRNSLSLTFSFFGPKI